MLFAFPIPELFLCYSEFIQLNTFVTGCFVCPCNIHHAFFFDVAQVKKIFSWDHLFLAGSEQT